MSLYGGAITTTLPEGAIDVSDFRQIPDTQEVFLLEKSSGLDQSIIIDLLERVEAPDLAQVVAVHLDDILDAPAAFIAPLESAVIPELGEVHSFLVKPPASKLETNDAKLFTFLTLIRVEKVGTDIVISMNVPLNIGEVTEKVFEEEKNGVINNSDTELAACYKQIMTIALTLKIQDWSLFS